MPPLGQVPAQRPGNTGTCVEELTSLANMHNAALPELLEKLKSKLQGFKYSIAKLDTYLTERINNPSEYGIYCMTSVPHLPKLVYLYSFLLSEFVS